MEFHQVTSKFAARYHNNQNTAKPQLQREALASRAINFVRKCRELFFHEPGQLSRCPLMKREVSKGREGRERVALGCRVPMEDLIKIRAANYVCSPYERLQTRVRRGNIGEMLLPGRAESVHRTKTEERKRIRQDPRETKTKGKLRVWNGEKDDASTGKEEP